MRLTALFFILSAAVAAQPWDFRANMGVGSDLSRFSFGQMSGEVGADAVFKLAAKTDFVISGKVNRSNIYRNVPNEYCDFGFCLRDATYKEEYEIRRDMAMLGAGIEQHFGRLTVGFSGGYGYVIGHRVLNRHTFDPGGNRDLSIQEYVVKGLGTEPSGSTYAYRYDSRWGGSAGANMFWSLNEAMDLGLTYTVSMAGRTLLRQSRYTNDVPPYETYSSEDTLFKLPSRSILLTLRYSPF